MKRVRVIGLVVIAVLGTWLAWRNFWPQAPTPVPPPAPVREVFHPSKPLRVEVRRAAADGRAAVTHDWLERELRYLLSRGKMKVAPLPYQDDPLPANSSASTESHAFTIRVTIDTATNTAQLALLAPDGVQERNESLQLATESQLATLRSLAERLPQFLGAPSTGDWAATIGTTESEVYDAFVRASDALLQPTAAGFTAPLAAAPEAVQILERVETLARRNRTFPRARGLLSIAYLSVGGEDRASLAKLAETAAERALAADPQSADAHAALGIVRLRRMDWSAAQEHFVAALAIDPSSLPALEGLACLLMDIGHAKTALPVAKRIVTLQPGNRGARQCETYASIAHDPTATAAADEPFDTAQIHVSMLLLAGKPVEAEALLKASDTNGSALAASVVGASTSKEQIPAALQAITSAVEDEKIDAETELLFGTALRRPDFVFNRMLRLVKQNEAVPLRMLWLPQTDFLRKHRRFKEVVSAASLTTYWQDHGLPDICTPEPKVHGCAVGSK